MEAFKFTKSGEYCVSVMRLSVIVERDQDGWYVGWVPELPGCHSQAKTLDELMNRIRESVDLYLEVEKTDMDVLREFVGVQFLEVSTREP